MSASGASVVKHGLNPEKGFMQVHYLKVSMPDGYCHLLQDGTPEARELNKVSNAAEAKESVSTSVTASQ